MEICLAIFGLHQCRVVLDTRKHKLVIVGVLVFLWVLAVGFEVSVYEKTLDPKMPDAAGVAAQPKILRYCINATQTAAKKSELVLCELRSFVYEYPVKFLASVFGVARFVALEVSELDYRPVDEIHLVEL